jgi:hypothetical protein|tara:strand:+ start:5517 stop:5819 length:303 start_codon:yes stop_codon:yes gene_type:complete
MANQSLLDELTKPEPKLLKNWYQKLSRDAQATLTAVRRKFAEEGGRTVSYAVLRDRLAAKFDGIPTCAKRIGEFLRGVSDMYPDVEAEDEPKQQAKRNRR